MAKRTRTYQTVFGENLRRIREEKGLRQDDVAKRMRGIGVRDWTQATVAAVEKDRRALSLGEALLLQQALQRPLSELGRLEPGQQTLDVEGAPVTASHWDDLTKAQPPPLEFSNAQALNFLSEVVTPIAAGSWTHAQWLAAGRVSAKYGHAEALTGTLLLDAERLAERRAARKLHVTPLELTAAAYALWGYGLTERRDAQVERTGDAASDRMRAAHVTRKLQERIAERIKAGRKKS